MNESKLYCNVCGESEFTTKEGFYFCNECGTQSQAIRDIIYEGEDNTGQFYKLRAKIKSNVEKPELTSWECFNYLLRGLVEELLELGAKEELKKVTLQLWTHYLRITEAAFFNKKQTELPKLHARFSSRDVKILYNQNVTKKKRLKKVNVSKSKQVIGKQVRKFMESEYEKLSQSDHTSSLHTSSTSRTSSASYATSRAIRLSFTMSARKYYKKKMGSSHLYKHEIDENSILKCHNLKYSPKLPFKDGNTHLSRQTIYTILYIALNLIQDDIQLSDILRYMREGHLSSSNIMHFFPDQISKNSEELIKSNIFFSRREIFLDTTIRRHTVFLCRLLNIKELKTPNLYNLIKRYINDLNLPNHIEIFINRLINLCPLQKIPLKLEHSKSPFYEARAMAFIIFILKLLFGLDDKKENIISESAKRINDEMELNGIQHKKIFVWNDWVEFIEMRKIILSKCHLPTAIQLNKIMNIEQYLEKFDANDDDDNDNDNKKLLIKHKIKIHNIHNIFENFQIKNKNIKTDYTEYKFSPSMTPNQTYLKEILKIKPENLNVPKFMYNDYSEFDMNCFINVKNLIDYFSKKQIQLKINKLSCKLERNHIGLIKNLFENRKQRDIMARKINYDIDENEWIENITKIDEKTKIIEKSQKKAKSKPIQLINKTKISSTEIDNHDINLKDKNILDKSYEMFSENNMDPLNENYFREPRRNLDYDDIFANLSDDDDDDNEEIIDKNEKYEKILEFNISNFDYWIIFGNFMRLNETNMKEIKNKFPKSFQWLLETCANQLGIDWQYLFNELIIVENYFTNVLESFENVKNFIIFKNESKQKDLENIIELYKNLW